MGGVAAIARADGHRVTGSDSNVYPPMSTQLEALGIELIEGYGAAQLDPVPDVVVVGNVMTRGQPVVEALLDRGIPYASGPEWLAREVLRERWVLAVAGTHGKTTTSSLLAWILEHAGLEPGFLIGGVPANFGTSARLGAAPFFVIEADEYDTAFFDKRAKFVHYHPRTLILNNLEYDHADIYPDVAAIERQFHHLVRTVPGGGRIVWNAADERLKETLAMGCWTPLEGFAGHGVPEAHWTGRAAGGVDDLSRFEVLEQGLPRATVQWGLIGTHNMENALAAIAAARHAGVAVEAAIEALHSFTGVARRMQLRGEVTAYVSMTTSPIIRRPLQLPSMDCGGASDRRGSSLSWSPVPTPCAWAFTGTRSRAHWPARTRFGCIRPPTWDGMRPPCLPPWAAAVMDAVMSRRWPGTSRRLYGPAIMRSS